MPQNFSLFLAASLHPIAPLKLLQTLLYVPVFRASVKFNTCVPQCQRSVRHAPQLGLGQAAVAEQVGGREQEPLAIPSLLPSLGLMCSRKIPG